MAIVLIVVVAQVTKMQRFSSILGQRYLFFFFVLNWRVLRVAARPNHRALLVAVRLAAETQARTHVPEALFGLELGGSARLGQLYT